MDLGLQGLELRFARQDGELQGPLLRAPRGLHREKHVMEGGRQEVEECPSGQQPRRVPAVERREIGRGQDRGDETGERRPGRPRRGW